MRNAGLEEAQVGIKIAGKNIDKLRYADDTTLMAESEEELKSLFFFFFFSVTALFYLEDSRGEREREQEKSARTWERESERKRFGSSFYMFFPPPGPALCKLGLAGSAVCSVCSA